MHIKLLKRLIKILKFDSQKRNGARKKKDGVELVMKKFIVIEEKKKFQMERTFRNYNSRNRKNVWKGVTEEHIAGFISLLHTCEYGV